MKTILSTFSRVSIYLTLLHQLGYKTAINISGEITTFAVITLLFHFGVAG
jgi:hypothetical protein